MLSVLFSMGLSLTTVGILACTMPAMCILLVEVCHVGSNAQSF